MESSTYIMQETETAKKYHEKTSILAWVHSHIHPNRSNFMSSIDIHTHRGLEVHFGNVQTIIVGIGKNKEVDHEFYDLTPVGRSRVKRCRNKGGFHTSCAYWGKII